MTPDPDPGDTASGAVVVWVDDEILDLPDLGEPVSPTLLVAPVTDALKTVSDDGFVTGSLDRDRTWRVVAFQLDAATGDRLAEEGIDGDRVYQAVVDMGLTWHLRPVDDLRLLPPVAPG